MTNFPDPERYPIGSLEREATQRRKNELMRLAAERLSATNPPASRAREDDFKGNALVARQQHVPPDALAANQRAVSEAKATRRERIALAFLVAMTAAGDAKLRNDGPDKYMIVNAIDAADRFIAELDGVPY